MKRTNEEFKNILMTLPEGIILINNETKQVTLGNYEFRRLFSVPKFASIDQIDSRINEKLLQTYSKASSTFRGGGHSGEPLNNQGTPSLSVLEAVKDRDSYSYKIVMDPFVNHTDTYHMHRPNRRETIRSRSSQRSLMKLGGSDTAPIGSNPFRRVETFIEVNGPNEGQNPSAPPPLSAEIVTFN